MVSDLRGLTPRQDARLGQVVHKVEGAIDRNTTPQNGNTWTPLIARVVEGSTVWSGGRGRCNPMKGTGAVGEEMVREATEAQKDDPTASQNTAFKHLTRDSSVAYDFVNLTGGTLDELDNLSLIRCSVEDSGSSELPGGCWVAITPGTDFGTAIVPRTTIPAVTRTVQAGSDLFTPGVGTAYLFKIATGGEIEPRLDLDGNAIWKTVYNYSTKEFLSNDVAMELQGGGVLEVQNDNPLDLQADLGPTDYIGPNTDVPFAVMDRSGLLNIPADLQGTGTSTTKIARVKGPAEIPFLDEFSFTPGVGTVEIWEFTNGVIADTLITVTAYNSATHAIPVDEFILIHQEAGNDRWMIDAPGVNLIHGFNKAIDGEELLFPYDDWQIWGDRDQAVVVGNIIDVQVSKAGDVVGTKISAQGDLFFVVDDAGAQEPIGLGNCLEMLTDVSFANFVLTPGSGSNPIITLEFGDLGTIIDDAAGSVSYEGGDTIEFTNAVVSKISSTITVAVAGSAADGKVKVRSGDASDFLEDNFLDHITDGDGDRYASAQDPLVEFQTDPTTPGSEQLRGFINSSDITGYSASGELHLSLDTNVLKWIAPGAASAWTAAGDSGANQTITGGDTLTLTGSGGAAAASAGDRGVTTVGTATDVMVFSVDASVLQSVDLSGTATSGTDPVLVSAGTRNQLQIISNTASTVEEGASKGWIQVVGGTGTIELILHEQTTSGFSFCVSADQGTVEVVNDTDTVEIIGSNLTAAAAQADRGVVSVASSGDTLTLSVDQTVLQSVDLSGTATSGTDPVLVSAGTRNQIQIISNTASTVEEGASKGWIQVVGGAGTIELILHEQTTTGYSFCVSADQGTVEVVNDTDTVEILGSNLTAAAAQADRGVVSVASSGDIITLSVDQTVLQSAALSGAGTSGTTPVLVSDGTRNQLTLVSGGSATTVQEGGSTGWVSIVGDGSGCIELILHEQTPAGFSFCVDGDQGPVQEIVDTNLLQILGSNLTPAGAQADRGIVSVASATDIITLSIDQSVLQKFNLSGTGTSGTDPVLVSAGTRNEVSLISGGSATTVEEAGSKGWVQIVGGTGSLELILHEQVSGGYSFCASGDKGVTQILTDTNTLNFAGSNLTAASVQARRGVISTGVATDIIQISIDETVTQEINVTGTGTTGTSLIQASAGTRNRFDFVSSCTSAVPDEGASGWIGLVGDGIGGISFVLHERDKYDFIAAGDKGSTQTITDGNTLTIEGSNLTAAAARADRGVIVTGVATDTLEVSVDQSVLQKFLLSGSGQTGSSCINVSDGTRNRIEIVSTNMSGSPAADPYIEIRGSSSTIELIFHPETGSEGLPVGTRIESGKAPIISGGKRYIDRDGAADTDWAWMDGSSNASPGSGVDMRNYFPRGTSSTSAVTNTAFGRSEASSTTDDDEVTVTATVTVDPHPSHIHTFNTDNCHGDVTVPDTHFDFDTSGAKNTSIQKTTGGGSMTLDHTVNPAVVSITNNSATPNANIEMLPAFKKSHWFEKVA